MPILRMKAIVPQHLPSTADYTNAIYKAFNDTVNLIERDMQSTTRTWTHKPQFRIVIGTRGKDLRATIGTDDPIYQYVDHGTKAHKIRAKRSKYLAFQSGYKAKTRVGIIGSQEGGAFGDTQIAKEVNHPGFPGRKFIATIRKRREVTMRQNIEHGIAVVNRTQK